MATIRLNVHNLSNGTQFQLQDLTGDTDLGDLLVLLEVETNIPSEDIAIQFNGRMISTPAPAAGAASTLAACGLTNDALILVNKKGAAFPPPPSAAAAAAAAAGAPALGAGLSGLLATLSRPRDRTQEMASLRDRLRSNPYELSVIREHNPDFVDAILGDDLAQFTRMVEQQEEAKRQRQQERSQLMQRIANNPFDVEAQRLLEEEIQMENVENLRQEAIEHMPESFGSVIMLYIDVVVNGHSLKAFVDSGAQMTIMSQQCADRCGITRFIDRRFQGMAVGVGSQRIIGRVHMFQLVVAGAHLPTSFSILEDQPMDMLLGLDMLKRHRCVIDLQNNKLIIGTTNTSTPFLSEADLPEHAKPRAKD